MNENTSLLRRSSVNYAAYVIWLCCALVMGLAWVIKDQQGLLTALLQHYGDGEHVRG